MILRGLHIIGKQLVYLSIIIAILLSLLFAGVYWLSNAIEQRQDEISGWASDKVGYPVEIGSASLDWVGLAPKLQVSDVKLLSQDQQQQLATLGNLYLGLDLIGSIQHGEPVLNDITLSDVNLTIVRDKGGKIQLQGFQLPDDQSAQSQEWISWVQLLSRFYLEAISVEYIDQQYVEFSGLYILKNGVITHQETDWNTAGELQLPASLGETIAFNAQADLNQMDMQLNGWQWQAELDNVLLAPLAESLVWQDVKLQKGWLTGEIIASGKGVDVSEISTQLQLSNATLINISELDVLPVEIDFLQCQLEWQRSANSWQLLGREMALSINGDSWPQTAFSIKKGEQGDVHVITQYLRLSDLSSLALLSSETPEIIRQQQPAGDVEALNFRYLQDEGLTELAFKLREGVVLPWQNYPGVTNLTGQINWQDGFGSVHLDSHNLTLYAKPWLDTAVNFDSVSGILKLESEQDKWQLNSQALSIWNEDLNLQLDGSINKTATGEIINDLKLVLADINVNRWKQYVPTKNLHIDFRKWSKDAFVAGKVTSGEITLKGDLSAFPYLKEPEKGAFNMALNVENVQLHYAPIWPDLTGLTGTITGSGDDLVIKTKRGKTAGFGFIDVTTVITKLTKTDPELRLQGEITGTTAKALQFLQDSPLKNRFGEVATLVSAEGKSNINLNLMVPLSNVDDTEASGHVTFNNSQLVYKDMPEITFSGVNGKLLFNGDGVEAKNIKATLFDEPVNVNVTPDGSSAVVSILGHVDTKQLNTTWPDKVPSFITGKTAYQVDLTVIERELGQFYLDIDLISDLKGLALAMPEPFGKTTNQAINLHASMQNKDNTLVFQADYGDVLNVIAKPDDELWQGEVRFGEGKASLPENGIKITGQLDELSVDDWLQWTEKQEGSKSKLTDSIDELSLTIASVTGFKQKLNNLNLASQKDAQGWRTRIHSDQAKGSVYLPNDLSGSKAIKIDLSRLALDLPSETEDEKEQSSSSLWPSLDIAVESLLIDDKALGQLSLQSRRNKDAWTINTAQLKSDNFILSVPTGAWKKSAGNDTSTMQLHIESDDLDLLLADFGYQQVIDAEKVTVTADLSWQGSPADVAVKTLSGSLNMDIGKGTLQDVEPGAAGRIFGLMSITALPRRLSLDFSDLFGKGFTFDAITADFDFANGKATTDNFVLRSASAEIVITGDVDLINKQYDQQVVITPNVSSTLPIAGAVAGGPVGLGVGTAILLVDKLTDKLFDKNIVNLISYKYDLVGPWHEPSISVSAPSQQSNTTATPRDVIR